MESKSKALPESAFYHHYREIDLENWPWEDFSPSEIACKGSGAILIDYRAMDALQKFRYLVGVPVVLNSAYRSTQHNKAIGGSPTSLHLAGCAFDVRITPRLTRQVIHDKAIEAGFTGIGDYNTFVHIDTGKKRYWDYRKT